MGSWDCYCAICGGPFHTVSVAQEPRSERFFRRHGLRRPQSSSSAHADQSTEDDHGDAADEESDNEVAGEASLEEITSEDGREDSSFDPDVITPRRTAWLEDIHILMKSENEDTGEEV